MASACTAPRIAIAIVALSLTSPSAISGSAQEPCRQTFNQLDRDLQEFQKDARTQGLNFLENDIAATNRSVDAIMDELLRQNPDEFYQDAEHLKQMMAKLYAEEQQAEAALGDVQQCLNTTGCSLAAFAARQAEGIRQWIQSLASRGVQDALQRVKKAQQILQDYAKRLGGMASGSMGAAAQCMNQYERGNGNPQTNVAPPNVAPPSTPPPSRTSPPHGLPAAVTVPIVAGGALLASDLIVKKVCGVDLWNAANCGKPNPDSDGVPTITAQTPIICSSATRQCEGSVTINFPMTMTSGTIWITTLPSLMTGGPASVNPTAPAGSWTFPVSRPYNTCYPTQTSISIWDAPNTNGSPRFTIDATIPVQLQGPPTLGCS